MTDKEIIKDRQRKILELRWEIDGILDKHLGLAEGQWHKVGYWDCLKSPVGLCVYSIVVDPSRDCCIYCAGPHERK